uniref:Uncharacterized protein n=1 Tax=Pantoea phage Survivor TaxID=3232176 RepID=A0AAU8KXN1_9CAUD
MLDPRVVAILNLRKDDPKPHIYRIKKTRIEMFPSGSASKLTPEQFDILGVYIMEGGCGWKAALKTQDIQWGRFGGRTIDMLKQAITICGFNLKEVLWDEQIFYFGGINEKDD